MSRALSGLSIRLVPVLLLSTGCWSQATASPPLSATQTAPAVSVERERALAAERRVAALEAELRAVEERSRKDAQADRQRASEKLDRLIEAQARLEAQLAKLEASQKAAPPATASRASTKDTACPAAATLAGDSARMEGYFLELLERSQSDAPPWRGGLSREKREALRILLRPERRLDTLEL